jgi:sugar lactone lactonase YvrE
MRRLVVAAGVAVLLITVTVTGTIGASAATWPITDPRVLVHFDAAAGQTPEGLAVEPDGAVDISLARASTAARVKRDGTVEVIGQLPRTGGCPFLGVPVSAGIARAHDGNLYLANCTGNADTGIWRLRRGHPPVQIARLPADAFPNDMTLDEHDRNLYLTDSLRGVVWRVPVTGGTPVAWADGPALQPVSLFGANGIDVHNDAVWVSNVDHGTIVRIPIRRDGTAGPAREVVSGLVTPDDFTVFGEDDTILATLVLSSQVVLIRPGRQPRVVLSAADGLSYASDVQLRGNTVYVSNFGNWNLPDPGANLLVARLNRVG